MATALAVLLIGLLAAGAGADDEASHGCPMCGAAVEPASVEPAAFQSCGIAGGGAAAWHESFPLLDVPPPVLGTQQQQPAAGGQAAEPLLDNPPSAEMCQALTAAVNAQDRATHFERAFGADGGGLRCEALAAAAKAAMARAVALAATAGPEQERLRRGRGRWHRSRLYHAMRQVYLDADLLKSEGDVLRDAERALLLARGRPLDSHPAVEAAADLVWDEVQALAGVRAETTPHAARREAWLTADLRYGGCERNLLPLVDADLSDPALVQLLNSKAARPAQRTPQPPDALQQHEHQRNAAAEADAKPRLRRRPAGPTGSAADISARRAAQFAAEEAARAADGGNASAMPPPPGSHLPASSWALVVLLVLPAAGLVALQASPRVQGRLPPVDLRQLLRSKQAEQRLAAADSSYTAGVAAGSGSRRGKHRRSGSTPANSHAPGAGPPDEAAAAAAGKARQGKSDGPVTAPPPPPPIRKQRSRGRGDSGTEGDTGSAASSVGGLPPDTPAQGQRPPARHAREDSSPDDSPRSSASSGKALRTPFAPPAPPPATLQRQPQQPQKRARTAAAASGSSLSSSGWSGMAGKPARGAPGPLAASQPPVSRTADLPAADRPLERSSRLSRQLPQPPPGQQLPAASTAAAAAAVLPQPIAASGRVSPFRSPSRPLQPTAAPFHPQSSSPLSAPPLQSAQEQLASPSAQYSQPAAQHQHPGSAQPPPPQQRAAMATAPSADDIDDLLADAWAFTNESAPPQRPPLPQHRPGPEPTAAATAPPLQHCAPHAFAQQPHPGVLSPSLHSISRTISSASSDATAASQPPATGLADHHGSHDAAAAGFASDGYPRASFRGPFSSPQQPPASSAYGVGWDGCRSGSSSPLLPPDAAAGSAYSAAYTVAQHTLSQQQQQQLPAGQSSTQQAVSAGSLGALLPADLSDDLLSSLDSISPGGVSPSDSIHNIAAPDALTQSQPPPRPPGPGPLQREIWPPARADAPGMRARLGERFQLPAAAAADPFHLPGLVAQPGGCAPSSAGMAALQTAAAAQFAAQRGLREAVLAAAAMASSPGATAAPPSPTALPRLALPSAAAAVQQAAAAGSPHALTQYQLWGASLQGCRAAAAAAHLAPGSPTTAAAACGSPFARRPLSSRSLPAVVAAPGSPAAAGSGGSSPPACSSAAGFGPLPPNLPHGASLLRPAGSAFAPGQAGRSLLGDAC